MQRLATVWKEIAGGLVTGIGSYLTATSELLDKLTKLLPGFENLLLAAKWLVVGFLAVLTVLCLWSALSRRSTLLRRERFIISADDPQHLVGRDKEVKELAKDCEQKALVFLYGESGAGKSALVLGGLLPHYQTIRAGHKAPRLLPIRIDASPLSWDNGLRIELARTLREVSPEEQQQLGAAAPLGSGDPFSWLAALPLDAPCQVLVVLDQIDDYAVAHQARFVRGHTVVDRERFEATNADWSALGSLVRQGSIHVLIVCREDAIGDLNALRSIEATNFKLYRVDRQLISRILDQITQADEEGPVVADPEHGWRQLKERLLRDLSDRRSQILPVQIAIGLDSVRRFAFLTPAEYAKKDGLRGLERRHIEQHLHDAASEAGLVPDALLRGLVCLIAENGMKTKRATLQEFAQAIGVTGPGVAALETAVKHLIRCRILRRQSAAEANTSFCTTTISSAVSVRRSARRTTGSICSANGPASSRRPSDGANAGGRCFR